MKSHRVYLVGDAAAAGELLRGVLGLVVFLRAGGDVVPGVVRVMGVDVPFCDKALEGVEEGLKGVCAGGDNSMVGILRVYNGTQCWEEWVVVVDTFDPKQGYASTDQGQALNFQIQPSYPLTYGDRDYVRMQLVSKGSGDTMYKAQLRTQCEEIVAIVDANKGVVPRTSPHFRFRAATTDNAESTITDLQTQFLTPPRSRGSMRGSDESLQFVSRSNIDQEPREEIWNKGYSFFKKMLE